MGSSKRSRLGRRRHGVGNVIVAAMLVSLVVSCGGSDDAASDETTTPSVGAADSTTTTVDSGWAEHEVTFPFAEDRLHGVLTLPNDEGPHPAVVLISGSAGPIGGRSGVSATTFIDHSHRLASEGFAVLRYDPPGVGRSTGEAGLPSLERRTEETAAALRYLQTAPMITANEIGLLGVSQGGWVIAMTAVRYPDDVAFLISVVGSGQSVAQQQIYGIEAQSRAAGLTEDDVDKAVLFGRLLLDWQLSDPLFRGLNEVDAASLGDGAWTDLMSLVYQPAVDDPVEGLRAVTQIMKSVQDEPWAAALYLEELYIPQFESIPADITPEGLAAIQVSVDQSLTVDPRDFLTEVQIPVLAFFGEQDVNVDTQKSAALYEQYLTEAGNEDFTIVVIPGVGHGITTSTPGYWDTLSDWLAHRYSN